MEQFIRFVCVVLLVVFIGLRITDTTDWHWAWVISPIWIGGITNIAFYLFGKKGR